MARGRARRSERSATARIGALLVAPLALSAALALPAREARSQGVVPTDFADSLVVGGFNFPTGFTFLPDGRVLVVEQGSGKVRLIVDGAHAAIDPVATLPGVRATGGEQGLLGIAVDQG